MKVSRVQSLWCALASAASVASLGIGLTAPAVVQAQPGHHATDPVRAPSADAAPLRTSDATHDSVMPAGPLLLTAGKSLLLRLSSPMTRVSVGNPEVLDVTLVSPQELFVLGKSVGSTNLMLWRTGAGVQVLDASVQWDVALLQQQLSAVFPQEAGIGVHAAGDSVVLSGRISSITRADHAVALADSFARTHARATPAGAARAGNARVVNLLRVDQPQQVMLEVQVAEVSRSVLDQLGISLDLTKTQGAVTYGLISSQLRDVFGSLKVTKNSNGSRATVDGKFDDGVIKILAEPTIVSVSGQEASFLAGGKVFIPVARSNEGSGTTITLEEKEFGIGVRFTPVVLDDDLIHLRVAPEVSELSRTGSAFVSSAGVSAVLPSFTTRRAQTTVQLHDGQSLVIAGLIKDNVAQSVSRFPFLGELPILGALFRSTDFQSDRTELVFLITPRLVKPLPPGTAKLPTDGFVPATRAQRLFSASPLDAAASSSTGSQP